MRLVLDEGRSVGPAARDLDLTEWPLRNWVERARADPGKGKDIVLERVPGADGVMRVVMHQKTVTRVHGDLQITGLRNRCVSAR